MVVSTRTRFNFNPRSHEESGVRRNLTKLKVLLFQSTLSRGERLWQSLPEHWEQKFQSTLSRGERRLANLIWVINLRFQSTLSRGERPYWRVYNDWFRDISIHALTRRAAVTRTTTGVLFIISIHALTRRAAMGSLLWRPVIKISIHALTRRAARRPIALTHCYLTFQSTLSRGERLRI